MISLEEYLTKWSALHGGAKLSLVVRIWLKLSFFLVKPLIRIGLSANAVSILGLLLGVATFLQAKSTLAILWIALSLICDGLDGTIAILKGTNSRFGAVLDSALDRSTEFFWLLALYQIGIQDWLLIIFFLISSLQEYLRARAGGAGPQPRAHLAHRDDHQRGGLPGTVDGHLVRRLRARGRARRHS